MPIIRDIVSYLDSLADPSLQESYDNAGLIAGSPEMECTGVITTLDCTEAVIAEAVAKGANLVVAHHPIVFKGLKKLTGKNYVERTVIAAIKQDIAIYAIHTNLDNVISGVNAYFADKIGLQHRKVLAPMPSTLLQIATYVPVTYAEQVRDALFAAGAGNIGNYDNCSFNAEGYGTFRAGEDTHPFVGTQGELHQEAECRVESIFPKYLKSKIIAALLQAHPYEEVAYNIYPLENDYNAIGAGLIGTLTEPMQETDFLQLLKEKFRLKVIRHTVLLNKKIRKVALCGGAGSFLTQNAIAAGADIYITGDVKYHEFFDADGKIVIADIGHYESEQFTIDLLFERLKSKFTTFAVLKSDTVTNPVQYFI